MCEAVVRLISKRLEESVCRFLFQGHTGAHNGQDPLLDLENAFSHDTNMKSLTPHGWSINTFATERNVFCSDAVARFHKTFNLETLNGVNLRHDMSYSYSRRHTWKARIISSVGSLLSDGEQDRVLVIAATGPLVVENRDGGRQGQAAPPPPLTSASTVRRNFEIVPFVALNGSALDQARWVNERETKGTIVEMKRSQTYLHGV